MQKPVIVRKWQIFKVREFLSLNKILEVLIFSDLVINSAYGLIAPILAVFLTDSISGGSLIVVGISDAIYLGVKSILQIPIGLKIDKTEGQKIDFWYLFLGNLLTSAGVFLYLFATLPWHVYLISLIFGIGGAMAYPAWTGLFTRNVVRNRESFAWSLSSTTMELGEAAAALIGGVVAQLLGFDILFGVVGALSTLGTLSLFSFYKTLKES